MFLSLLIFFSFAANADSRRVGNGGDSYAIEFVASADDTVRILNKFGSADVDLRELGRAVLETTVESTDKELYLNGMRKDAINYPLEKRIIFNRKAWDSLGTKLPKYALIVHEYLGIIGVDDSKYNLSMKLMKVFGKTVIRCESRFLYRSEGHILVGEVEGSTVLDLKKEEVYHWKDELRKYTVSAGEEYIQFDINPLKHSGKPENLVMRASLSLERPSFYTKFPVDTNLQRNNGQVFLIQVFCQ